jgi:hypothetical protein
MHAFLYEQLFGWLVCMLLLSPCFGLFAFSNACHWPCTSLLQGYVLHMIADVTLIFSQYFLYFVREPLGQNQVALYCSLAVT